MPELKQLFFFFPSPRSVLWLTADLSQPFPESEDIVHSHKLRYPLNQVSFKIFATSEFTYFLKFNLEQLVFCRHVQGLGVSDHSFITYFKLVPSHFSALGWNRKIRQLHEFPDVTLQQGETNKQTKQ